MVQNGEWSGPKFLAHESLEGFHNRPTLSIQRQTISDQDNPLVGISISANDRLQEPLGVLRIETDVLPLCDRDLTFFDDDRVELEAPDGPDDAEHSVADGLPVFTGMECLQLHPTVEELISQLTELSREGSRGPRGQCTKDVELSSAGREIQVA